VEIPDGSRQATNGGGHITGVRSRDFRYRSLFLLVRAGVGLPTLMKLLGHVNHEMTMRYVEVAGTDLQREFHLARSQPRRLAPQPKAPNSSPRGGLDGVKRRRCAAAQLSRLKPKSPGHFLRGLDDGTGLQVDGRKELFQTYLLQR
jgi:hypothetical protein